MFSHYDEPITRWPDSMLRTMRILDRHHKAGRCKLGAIMKHNAVDGKYLARLVKLLDEMFNGQALESWLFASR